MEGKKRNLFNPNNLSYIPIAKNQFRKKMLYLYYEQFMQFHLIVSFSKISWEICLHIQWNYFWHELALAICLFCTEASFEYHGQQ